MVYTRESSKLDRMTTLYEKELHAIAKEEKELDAEMENLKKDITAFGVFKATHEEMMTLQKDAERLNRELDIKEAQLKREKALYLDVPTSNIQLNSIGRENYDKMMSIFSDFDYKDKPKSIESIETTELCFLSVKCEGVLLMEQYIAKDLFF